MTYSSCLADDLTPLVLDTSVLINLHASTHGGRILSAIPNEIIVSEVVLAELDHETSRSNGEHDFVRELAEYGKIQLTALSEMEIAVYENLVSGSSSLDDGEASTIAIAACRMNLPIIDERKGRLCADEHCSGAPLGWSLDVFRHPQVVMTLGTDVAVDALFFALRDGRMRIHKDHCDYVVSLIGKPRALECNSLPGYKLRRLEWKSK